MIRCMYAQITVTKLRQESHNGEQLKDDVVHVILEGAKPPSRKWRGNVVRQWMFRWWKKCMLQKVKEVAESIKDVKA